MGNRCVKQEQRPEDLGDLRDEKARREYYLNMNNSGSNNIGSSNYDITEKKLVGYGHIQKTNLFHQVSRCK
jgi:hypothetical protein